MTDTTFKFRRGDSDTWVLHNPILLSGEPGYETDTGMLKFGDGGTRWNDLEYFNPAGEGGVDPRIGNMDDLNTDHKSTVVGSINEVNFISPTLTLLYENAKAG